MQAKCRDVFLRYMSEKGYFKFVNIMLSSVRISKTLKYGIALSLLAVSKEHATTTFILPHDSVKSWLSLALQATDSES